MRWTIGDSFIHMIVDGRSMRGLLHNKVGLSNWSGRFGRKLRHSLARCRRRDVPRGRFARVDFDTARCGLKP